jgi:hypothetical protein
MGHLIIILDRSTYVYRRVFTDSVRAVDAVRTHPAVEPTRVVNPTARVHAPSPDFPGLPRTRPAPTGSSCTASAGTTTPIRAQCSNLWYERHCASANRAPGPVTQWVIGPAR